MKHRQSGPAFAWRITLTVVSALWFGYLLEVSAAWAVLGGCLLAWNLALLATVHRDRFYD